MRALFSILIFCFGVLTYSAQAHALQKFQFIEWQDCSEKIVCKTIKPKKWKKSEVSTVLKILNRFEAGGLLHVLESIQGAGYISFQRIQRGYNITHTNSNVKSAQPDLGVWAFAVVGTPNLTIAITDKFFKSKMVDPYSGASIQQIYLLHEIAHAFDHTLKLSWDPEFLRLIKFDSQGYYIGVSYEEFKKFHNQDALFEIIDNNPEKALKYQREVGMSLGLPRLYSMSNPNEAFADLVAFIYLDSNASNYIDKKLIQYIDKNILKGFRASK